MRRVLMATALLLALPAPASAAVRRAAVPARDELGRLPGADRRPGRARALDALRRRAARRDARRPRAAGVDRPRGAAVLSAGRRRSRWGRRARGCEQARRAGRRPRSGRDLVRAGRDLLAARVRDVGRRLPARRCRRRLGGVRRRLHRRAVEGRPACAGRDVRCGDARRDRLGGRRGGGLARRRRRGAAGVHRSDGRPGRDGSAGRGVRSGPEVALQRLLQRHAGAGDHARRTRAARRAGPTRASRSSSASPAASSCAGRRSSSATAAAGRRAALRRHGDHRVGGVRSRLRVAPRRRRPVRAAHRGPAGAAAGVLRLQLVRLLHPRRRPADRAVGRAGHARSRRPRAAGLAGPRDRAARRHGHAHRPGRDRPRWAARSGRPAG